MDEVDYQVAVLDYQVDKVGYHVVVLDQGNQVNQVEVLKPLLFCSGELESQFAEKVDK